MKSLKEKFFEVMENDACDLMEILFISENEKADYIKKSWENAQDEIECFIEGEIGDMLNFETSLIDAYNETDKKESLEEYYNGIVLSAIYENRELVFAD